jgi:hypothetical protein
MRATQSLSIVYWLRSVGFMCVSIVVTQHRSCSTYIHASLYRARLNIREQVVVQSLLKRCSVRTKVLTTPNGAPRFWHRGNDSYSAPMCVSTISSCNVRILRHTNASHRARHCEASRSLPEAWPWAKQNRGVCQVLRHFRDGRRDDDELLPRSARYICEKEENLVFVIWGSSLYGQTKRTGWC